MQCEALALSVGSYDFPRHDYDYITLLQSDMIMITIMITPKYVINYNRNNPGLKLLVL